MEESQPATKRPRLSMACNDCRRRKVKCDANPQCKNCARRKIECVTTDPKQPGAPVLREWIEDKSVATSPRLAVTNGHSQSQATAVGGTVQQHQTPELNDIHRVRPSDNSSVNHTVSQGERYSTQVATLVEPPAETNELSPVYNHHDMYFHTDQNTNRIKMMGASSSQCLIKSLDLYLEVSRVKPVAPTLKYGMRHAEEMALPLSISLPPFPTLENRQRYITAFFNRIFRLWPVVDVDGTKSAIHAFASMQNLSTTPHEQTPLLAIAYLIMSLGADEDARQLTEDGNIYLQAATSLLGHIILMPYLGAVQALLLFTVAYRGRNKDGIGWQTAGMAVRIAHSLGLHKHSGIRPSKLHGVTEKRHQLFHARIWAICCCLEKIIELESGRPSAILQLTQDQFMERDQNPVGHNFLKWNLGLAEHQNLIGRHIYGYRPGECSAKEILQRVAQVDRVLLEWCNQLPHQFQPENAMFCSNDEFHFAAFLAIQFHQSMIALHRAALIAPQGTFDAEVEKWCSEEPSKYRLQHGELICINSARAIIRLSLELSERNAESRIVTATPPLLACVALAIFLVKHPRGRSQAADLELLKAAVEHTSDEFIKTGQDRRMAQGILSIHEKVRLHFRHTAAATKRSNGDIASAQDIQNNTPSSRNGETASIDGAANHQSQRTSRPTSAPNPGTVPEHRNPTAERYGPNSINHQVSPSGAAVDRSGLVISELATSRNDHPGAHNNWTSPAISQDYQHQHLLTGGGSENVLDNLSMSQDATGGGPGADRLPFGEFNVEEMWNWMCVMDATNDFQPVASWDQNG